MGRKLRSLPTVSQGEFVILAKSFPTALSPPAQPWRWGTGSLAQRAPWAPGGFLRWRPDLCRAGGSAAQAAPPRPSPLAPAGKVAAFGEGGTGATFGNSRREPTARGESRVPRRAQHPRPLPRPGGSPAGFRGAPAPGAPRPPVPGGRGLGPARWGPAERRPRHRGDAGGGRGEGDLAAAPPARSGGWLQVGGCEAAGARRPRAGPGDGGRGVDGLPPRRRPSPGPGRRRGPVLTHAPALPPAPPRGRPVEVARAAEAAGRRRFPVREERAPALCPEGPAGSPRATAGPVPPESFPRPVRADTGGSRGPRRRGRPCPLGQRWAGPPAALRPARGRAGAAAAPGTRVPAHTGSLARNLKLVSGTLPTLPFSLLLTFGVVFVDVLVLIILWGKDYLFIPSALCERTGCIIWLALFNRTVISVGFTIPRSGCGFWVVISAQNYFSITCVFGV